MHRPCLFSPEESPPAEKRGRKADWPCPLHQPCPPKGDGYSASHRLSDFPGHRRCELLGVSQLRPPVPRIKTLAQLIVHGSLTRFRRVQSTRRRRISLPMNRESKTCLFERHAGKSLCILILHIPRTSQPRQRRLELLGDFVAQVDGLFSSVGTKVLALDQPEIVPVGVKGDEVDRLRGAAEGLETLSMEVRLVPLDRIPAFWEIVYEISLPKFRPQDPRRQDTGRTGSIPRREGSGFGCRSNHPTARP